MMEQRDLMRVGGRAGMVAAVTGVLTGIIMAAWPERVPPGVVHYPFSLTGYYVVQTWLSVHHLLMLAALIALVRSGATGPRWLGRFGAWSAVVGTLGLSGAELFAMRFAETDFEVANQGAMGSAYAASSNLIGLGCVLAGIAIVRGRTWTGWWRWAPLVIGLWHFLVLTPCLFIGYVAARFGIASRMLLFAALGVGLVREAEHLGSGAPDTRPA